MSGRTGDRIGRGGARGVAWYTMLIGLTLVFATPLLWGLFTSFKTQSEATAFPPTFFPAKPTIEAYGDVFAGNTQTPVPRWLLNSAIAATGQTLLVLVVASAAAYALARLEFRGKRVMFAVIVGTLLIPGFTLLIPNFLIVDGIGWLDSLWALIVPGAASAFGVFFLRQFFWACRASWTRRRCWTAPTTSTSSPASCCRCRAWRWPRSPSSPSWPTGTTSSGPST